MSIRSTSLQKYPYIYTICVKLCTFILPFTTVALFIDTIKVVKAFNTKDISERRYLKKILLKNPNINFKMLI